MFVTVPDESLKMNPDQDTIYEHDWTSIHTSVSRNPNDNIWAIPDDEACKSTIWAIPEALANLLVARELACDVAAAGELAAMRRTRAELVELAYHSHQPLMMGRAAATDYSTEDLSAEL